MNLNAIIPVMAMAIVNGIFSPMVLFVFLLYPVWYPTWAPPLMQAVYMFSALILSTLTLMVSGIPAALYERLSRDAQPSVTAGIWTVAATLLTLPALPNVLRALALG